MDLHGRLLTYYGLTDSSHQERLSVKGFGRLPDPFKHLGGFEKALALMKETVGRGRKTVIYGDYDVDGMTGTAIILSSLRRLGAECGYFIPSRYKEGYGLTSERVRQFAAKGYSLLITVDNGISAFEPIKEARRLGLDVIVVDHHEIASALPEATCIIHDRYPAPYAPYEVSAAYLALLISYGLLGFYDDYLAALAGLAVFSDVMALKGGNLALARHAMEMASSGRFRQLSLLLKKGGVGPVLHVTSRDLAFDVIAPLNGLGRVDIGMRNNDAIRFLLSEDAQETDRLYGMISKVSLYKKQKLSALRKILDGRVPDPGVSVVFLPEADQGLLGAAAGYYMEKTGRAAILLAPLASDSSLLVGSGRGPEGTHLMSLVGTLGRMFAAFGGHDNAFGLTMRKDDLPAFRKEIARLAEEIKAAPAPAKAVGLDPDGISLASLAELMTFEPFGNGFPSPLFACRVGLKDVSYSAGGRHMLLRTGSGGEITYFSFDRRLLGRTGEVILLGRLSGDEYRGKRRARLNCEGWEEPDAAGIIK